MECPQALPEVGREWLVGVAAVQLAVQLASDHEQRRERPAWAGEGGDAEVGGLLKLARSCGDDAEGEPSFGHSHRW